MDNLDLMRERLRVRGGATQQERMIKDKRETLERVVKYSYQGAKVLAIGEIEPAVALINPNAVKQDYDDKVISIDFDYGFTVGTVFDWLNTGTKWLVYLQDLTELAYFKGDIRKCSYELQWEQDGRVYTSYAALTGPSEKKIDSTIKEGISVDSPNYTLHFYLPNTPQTFEYFTRYAKFYLQGNKTCWRVEAIDSISMPGVLEIYATEYYANEYEDNIDKGLVGDLIVEPITPEPSTEEIMGEIFIKPKKTYTYEYVGAAAGNWSWDKKLPIKATIDGNKITIKWDTTYSGQFELSFGDTRKTIVIESLF